MATAKTDYSWAIRQVQLFQGMDQTSLDLLLDNCRVRRFPRGHTLCEEGEPAMSLFILVSGRVQVENQVGGATTVAGLRGAGEVVGEMALIEDGLRTATIRVLEDVRALELQQENFVRCLRRSPDFALRLMASLSRRLREATRESAHLRSQQQILTRLAIFLEEAAREGGGQTPPLTNEEIGQRIGAKRETVNRALRHLETSQVISRSPKSRRSYVIDDAARLRQLSEGVNGE